ncbi:hypothetical protein [Streptomyces sp. NPDC050738]|uniref:hypothetical protein n=1 Tax=Streptomyces sp. NPDC050738 TaxID=3154744 RepID=UPI003429C64E
MRKSMKLYVLGAVVATALTATACDPSSGDKKADDKSSAPASAPSKPGKTTGAGTTGTATTPTTPQPSKGGSGGGYKYANRQKPPSTMVCEHGGQGPYGSIESVNFGGESPNTVIGLVLGSYECVGGDGAPTFTPNSATGAATDVLLDDAHLKVVVGGDLASKLGTKTPSASKFVDQLAKMQDSGQLKGRKAPQFYFRLDTPSDDVNTTPDDNTHVIYLYQLILTDGS